MAAKKSSKGSPKTVGAKKDNWRKFGGPRALAAVLPKVAGPALRKRGFAAAEIVTRWAEIAGEEMAAGSAPDHLSFPKGARQGGTLYIAASGSVALQIQHQEPSILQRINTYFGYPAVARLSISQASFKSKVVNTESLEQPETTPEQIARIESETCVISEPDLRQALHKLGEAVERDRAAQKSRKSKSSE
jgi:hypothetical protein